MTAITNTNRWNNINTSLSKVNMKKQLIKYDLSIYQWSRMPVNDIRIWIRNKIGEPNVEAPNIEEPTRVEMILIEKSPVYEQIVTMNLIEKPHIEEYHIEEQIVEIETTRVEMNLIKEPHVIEESPIETPIVETPEIEESPIETPIVETPIVETPEIEESPIETTIVETPIVEIEEPTDYINTIICNNNDNDPNELINAYVNNIQHMIGNDNHIYFTEFEDMEISCDSIGEFEDDLKYINHLIEDPELEPKDVVLSKLWLLIDPSWKGSKQRRYLNKHMNFNITNWVKIGSIRRNDKLILIKADATIVIGKYEKSLDSHGKPSDI
jgi:hypothetical protein